MGLRQEFKETSDSLEVTYHWYEAYHKVGCIFFLVWDLLSIAFYHPELIPLFKGELTFPKNIFALCLFFMLIPVPTYWMLVYVMNKTRVHLSASQVVVLNGPLPWWRNNFSFASKEIKYIWIAERSPDSIDDESRDVKAIMKNGESRYLFLNIQNPEECRIISSRISLWLIKMNKPQLYEDRT